MTLPAVVASWLESTLHNVQRQCRRLDPGSNHVWAWYHINIQAACDLLFLTDALGVPKFEMKGIQCSRADREDLSSNLSKGKKFTKIIIYNFTKKLSLFHFFSLQLERTPLFAA